MRDIQDLADIKMFVDHFYNEVKTDVLLGPIFNKHIPEETWQSHMDIIYTFWESILFDTATYRNNAFVKHMSLEIEKRHFDTWLKQFNQSIDLHFKGALAEKAKARATSIALLFQHKLDQLEG